MRIKTNYPYFIGCNANNSNNVVILINRQEKCFCDNVEIPVGYVHSPKKIFDVINMILMWFSLRDDHDKP